MKRDAPYLGLARKYRPQAFGEIVGQEAVSTTLQNALAEGKTAHAYLFFGPRGVGKTTAARILAKCLNCAKGPGPEPCGKCDSCREIALSGSIDVLELDAATHTQVDRIREMIVETVSLAPSRDRFKVFIIDEVHMLSTASFNALLKTLEEPPAHVAFVLATTDPGKIPATIVSRCQRFRFRPLPAELLESRLKELAKAEKIPVSPAALGLLARAAAGSLRDAVSLLEQAAAYAEGEVREEDVRELSGSLPQDLVLAVAKAVLARDAKALAQALARVSEDGCEPAQLLRDLRDRLHECCLSRLGVGEGLDDAWRGLAGDRPPMVFSHLLARVNKALEGLRSSDSPGLSLEMGLYGMLEPAHDLQGWVGRLESLEKRLAAGGGLAEPGVGGPAAIPAPGVPGDPPAPSAAPEEPLVVFSEPRDIWPSVLKRLEGEKPGLAHALRSGRLLPGPGGRWKLVFRRSFDLDRAKHNLALIEASLATATGNKIQLVLETSEELPEEEKPAPGPKDARKEGSAEAGERGSKKAESAPGWKDVVEEAPAEDPAVKKVLDVFPGKVRHVRRK